MGEYTMVYGVPATYEFVCTAVDDMGNVGTGTVHVEVQERKSICLQVPTHVRIQLKQLKSVFLETLFH